MAPGLATAQSLGNTKFANAPPLRLTRPANALQLPGGGGGGLGWPQLEFHYIKVPLY